MSMEPNLNNVVKELQNVNKNLQSINQTLNQMLVVSKFKAGLITFNDATPKFRPGMEMK